MPTSYPTPTDKKEEIAKIINRYIDECDSSLRELATFANISHSTFANWANAKLKPRALTITVELNHVKENTPGWVYGMYREILDVLY